MLGPDGQSGTSKEEETTRGRAIIARLKVMAYASRRYVLCYGVDAKGLIACM
jgi:hypothetical protein